MRAKAPRPPPAAPHLPPLSRRRRSCRRPRLDSRGSVAASRVAVINLRLDGVELLFPEGEDIQQWKPPPTGVLRFDYVATKRVPPSVKPQRAEVFSSFKKELSNPALSEETKLLMLRSAATTHYWTAAQVREMVVLITFQKRVDAVVMLFRRCAAAAPPCLGAPAVASRDLP